MGIRNPATVSRPPFIAELARAIEFQAAELREFAEHVVEYTGPGLSPQMIADNLEELAAETRGMSTSIGAASPKPAVFRIELAAVGAQWTLHVTAPDGTVIEEDGGDSAEWMLAAIRKHMAAHDVGTTPSHTVNYYGTDSARTCDARPQPDNVRFPDQPPCNRGSGSPPHFFGRGTATCGCPYCEQPPTHTGTASVADGRVRV